jgi:hypothetical protein
MKVEVDLTPEVYERISAAASKESLSVNEVIVRLIARPCDAGESRGSIVGRYSSEADLLDEVCREAMSDREHIPMRTS